MTETPGASWLRCSPYIAAALKCSGETHTMDDVKAGIEAGEFQFWPGEKCAAVTEVWTTPRMKTLNLWLLGGNLTELQRLVAAIVRSARANGCGRVVAGGVFGRRGWERAGRALGFEPRWTVYAKDLSP